MSEEIDQTVGGDHDTWILFNRETVDGYPLVVLARTGNPYLSPREREFSPFSLGEKGWG